LRSLQQWLAYQQGTHARPIDLSLERVREVAARLRLLQWHCPIAIVGGTNGKGSTATLLAQLLCASGQRVGLFTSPHLLRYNERVQIDGSGVSDAALIAAFERIESARCEITLTFFEYGTLAALLAFRDAQIQSMVLEVGLGGRLDATNILDADVALLCSVGLDHRQWLGETLEQIGAEKAGIFRPRQPVVLGSAQMPASVWRRLAELECRTLTAEREFSWAIHGSGFEAQSWDYRGPGCHLEQLPAPALRGAIQYRNAATALTALQLLGVSGGCDHARVSEALQRVRLPGRLQIVPGEIEWILDVAHNEPAAHVLAQALSARPSRGRTLAVLGMLSDKDAAAITRVLDAHIDRWVLTGTEEEPRGLSAEALAARLPALRGALEREPSVNAACERARREAQPGDRIVVFGSFHVVGPALAWLGLY
jgi:dihydrofolate synthase/folylpolyglutamate synthase